MPVPTLAATDASAALSGSATMSHTIPAGWAAGDLVLAIVHTFTRTVSTAPSGWTQLETQVSDGERGYVYWKQIASGDVGASISWVCNASVSSGRIVFIRITGHDTTTPINVSASANEPTTRTAHVSPSVTTTVDDCLVVRAIAVGNTSVDSSSGDAGTVAYSTTVLPGYFVYQSSKATAGSTGTATYNTGASRAWSHYVVAVAPAAASPTVRTGASTLAGIGSLSCGGLAIRTRSASLAGVGSLSSGRLAIRTRSASLAGAGSLSSGRLAIRVRSAALAGVGSLSSGRLAIRTRSSTLAGAGSLSSGGLAIRTRSSSLAGIGSVVVAGQNVSSNVRTGSASIPGIGSLSSGRLAIRTRSSTLAGVADLTATGSRIVAGVRLGAAALAGIGTLVASATAPLRLRGSALAGVGSVVVVGVRVGVINTLEERLVDTLRGTVGLVAIVGGRIFEGERPQGEGLPAVVWTIDRTNIEDLDGPTGLVEARIDLETQAKKRSTARQAAASIKSAVYTLEQSTGPIIQAVVVDELEAESGSFEDGSGSLVHFEAISVRAWVRE